MHREVSVIAFQPTSTVNNASWRFMVASNETSHELSPSFSPSTRLNDLAYYPDQPNLISFTAVEPLHPCDRVDAIKFTKGDEYHWSAVAMLEEDKIHTKLNTQTRE